MHHRFTMVTAKTMEYGDSNLELIINKKEMLPQHLEVDKIIPMPDLNILTIKA